MAVDVDGSATSARPWIILMTCCLSLLMVAMDVTIVNVALPSIQRDLEASTSGLQWTIDAYTLVVASLLMLAGSMADRFGRRPVFQTGMALFCAGSILCAAAPTIGWLIVFRGLQALGGTMLNPVAVAIITNTFTEPRERARAIGIWGAVFGLGLGAGPIVGGFLTQIWGWRAIFWVNVPFGCLAIVLTALFVPDSRAARPRRVDGVGQLLMIVILGALIAAVIEGPRLGWDSLATAGLFAMSALALVALLLYEPRRKEPLLDVQLFRSVPFASATIMAVCAFGAFSAFLFLNALYLQDVLGFSASRAGLCTAPLAIGTILCPPISGRMLSRRGARPPLVCASLGMAASALMLTRLEATTPLCYVLVAYAIFGAGFGLVNAPITYAAVSGLPRDRAGLAAGIASASRQTGASIGVALAGTLAGAHLAAHGSGTFAEATHLVWWLVLGSSLLILALALLSTSPWGIATSRHAAFLFAEEGNG